MVAKLKKQLLRERTANSIGKTQFNLVLDRIMSKVWEITQKKRLSEFFKH